MQVCQPTDRQGRNFQPPRVRFSITGKGPSRTRHIFASGPPGSAHGSGVRRSRVAIVGVTGRTDQATPPVPGCRLVPVQSAARAADRGHTLVVPSDPTFDSAMFYYEQGREHDRLETGCRLEFLRTTLELHRFLPPPPARVLDGGDSVDGPSNSTAFANTIEGKPEVASLPARCP